jgi:hypothetical protein
VRGVYNRLFTKSLFEISYVFTFEREERFPKISFEGMKRLFCKKFLSKICSILLCEEVSYRNILTKMDIDFSINSVIVEFVINLKGEIL